MARASAGAQANQSIAGCHAPFNAASTGTAKIPHAKSLPPFAGAAYHMPPASRMIRLEMSRREASSASRREKYSSAAEIVSSQRPSFAALVFRPVRQ